MIRRQSVLHLFICLKMGSKMSVMETDSFAEYLPDNESSDVDKTLDEPSKTLFQDFTRDDYISIFFLLMDYVGLDYFLNLTEKSETFLMQEFDKIFATEFNHDSNILVELLGIIKKYKKLRSLDTCKCIYKNLKERKINFIDPIWKMLYSLCEELTDDDLELLKNKVPDKFKYLIVTAEHWFCWSLKYNLFSKTDLSKLELLFSNDYPRCLTIIQNFTVESKLYSIKDPSSISHCGVALLINFDTFDEKTKLPKREGSDVDVISLTKLWQDFGFKTFEHSNLTGSQTLELLKKYAEHDHSSYDLFVCCILSHGESNSILASDGEMMHIPVLMSAICNKCPSLDQKPKLFFIQACQGNCIYIPQSIGDPVYELKNSFVATETVKCNLPKPITCDTLRVTSSIDGFVSFRNPKTGSVFIQTLCKIMMQYGHKKSILDIITEVNNDVRHYRANLGLGRPRNGKQIVHCAHTFGKTLILKRCV